MAWIELHQSLWTHKKTLILASLLDIDDIYAAAHMSKFWTWALDNAQDGDLSGLPKKVIAFGAGWKGDADQFVDAVVAAGWINQDDNGVLSIHDWYDYAGRLIDKKKANKERMKQARAKQEDSTNDECATHVQCTNNARAGATEPNRTIPNQTKDKDAHGSDESKKQKKKSDEKIAYAEYVRMTEKEYDTLVQKHGNQLTLLMIQELDNYKGAKGTTYKSDYRAILNWVEEKVLAKYQNLKLAQKADEPTIEYDEYGMPINYQPYQDPHVQRFGGG